MTRQPNAVDFWRGFALVTIFVNHVPGLFLEKFTYRNFSISDSADLFVFLAGWALFLSISRPGEPAPIGGVLSRLGGRVVTIYAAQLLISCIAIAMLAQAAKAFENPILLEWHNAAAVFYDPVNAHIGLVLLTYQLGYFDILPLYVVLMMTAPLMVVIHRYLPGALLPVSLFIYLCALVFEVTVHSWPTSGSWFFNPLAWQFLFVLGFLLADPDRLGRLVQKYRKPLMVIAAPIVIMGALIMQFSWWPDPFSVPEPKLLFIADKTHMTPIRLIQFLGLVMLFSAVYPYMARLSPGFSQFLSMLGRNSLNVFCVGSVLSLACQILHFVYERSIMIDMVIIFLGVGLLGLTAWISEWRGAMQPAKPVQSASYGSSSPSHQ